MLVLILLPNLILAISQISQQIMIHIDYEDDDDDDDDDNDDDDDDANDG